jgi:hypothetical protein
MVTAISDEEIKRLRETVSGIENMPDAVLKRKGWSVEKIKKVLELRKANKFLELGKYLAFGSTESIKTGDLTPIDNYLGMTALEMAREACSYLGLPLLETLQDVSSDLSSIMLSLLNRACSVATLEYDWNQLIINYHFGDISD